jgi:hypothetical protein
MVPRHQRAGLYKMKTILIAYTAYPLGVASNMSLNAAAYVTVITVSALLWVGTRGFTRPVPKNTCPECLVPLHPIRSQFIKMCGSCDYQEPWGLKPGQKPLITNNRQKG